MKWASVCSGIGAPEVAWGGLWGLPEFVAEIELFPSEVLAHRFGAGTANGPPNYGDFTRIGADVDPVDLLVAGTPCQDFSVAGKRLGLDAPRGNLALEFLALARRLRPRWLVFENVPGLLSNWSGATPDELQPGQSREFVESSDFAAFLGAVRESGYLGCWRHLDAQFAGVPQRRERLFAVFHLGDWRPPAAVLFERESLSGHPAPRREAGAGVTALSSSGVGTCGADDNQAQGGHLVSANTVTAREGRMRQDHTLVAHSLRADGFDASEDGTGRGTPLVPVSVGLGSDPLYAEEMAQPVTNRNGDPGVIAFTAKDQGADAGKTAPTLQSMGRDVSQANGGGQVAVAISGRARGDDGRGYGREPMVIEDATGALDTVKPWSVASNMTVRRLTPRECERLQGLPDDFTRIPWRGKPAEHCPDGPRYKAIGNSMAIPCVRWIGERIAAVAEMPP